MNAILQELSEIKEQRSDLKESNHSIIVNLKNDIAEINKLLQSNLDSNSLSLKENAEIKYETNDSGNNKILETIKDESVIKEIINKISNIEKQQHVKNFNNQTNNYYTSYSKFGKNLSLSLEKEVELPKLLPYDINTFYKVFCKDLYRKGSFESADCLIQETDIVLNANYKILFKDLRDINSDLKEKDLRSLENWCVKYKNELDEFDSTISYDIAVYKFFVCMLNPSIDNFDILMGCKSIFKEFNQNKKYLDKISNLLSLLLVRNISEHINTSLKEVFFDERNFKIKNLNFLSVCKSIFNLKGKGEAGVTEILNDLIQSISLNFNKDCCSIINFPKESGFFLTLQAGMFALPQIIKAEKVFKIKKEVLKKKELPYELKLTNEMKFHPVFICPVTKEASCEDNPPMLLVCGHAISNGLHVTHEIKCPTCPNTQNPSEAIELKIFN